MAGSPFQASKHSMKTAGPKAPMAFDAGASAGLATQPPGIRIDSQPLRMQHFPGLRPANLSPLWVQIFSRRNSAPCKSAWSFALTEPGTPPTASGPRPMSSRLSRAIRANSGADTFRGSCHLPEGRRHQRVAGRTACCRGDRRGDRGHHPYRLPVPGASAPPPPTGMRTGTTCLPTEIFLFGFSRGAFAARSLVGLLGLGRPAEAAKPWQPCDSLDLLP